MRLLQVSFSGEEYPKMQNVFLWLLGVPISVLLVLNVLGYL